MKKFRKSNKIIIGILVLIILYIAYKIGSPFIIMPREVRELNHNLVLTEFPYKLGEEINNVDRKALKENEWTESYGYGDREISYNNNIATVWFDGFPDLSSSSKFVSYETEYDNISVFDIKIGSGIDDARKKLENMGYKKIVSYSAGDVDYSKGRVQIGLKYEFFETNGKITEIMISLESSDWLHNGYYK